MPFLRISSVLLIVCFFCITNTHATTYYVDINGSDSSGSGTSANPWRSIHAALNKVKYGDIISINDGIYEEPQLRLPEGVSLVSTSKETAKVKLQPASHIVNFITAISNEPGSNGNQSISYLEIAGKGPSGSASKAIFIKGRNNIRIHHNHIHDFSKAKFSFAIYVTTHNPINVKNWPDDPQEPGIDRNLDAIWPKNPIVGLEIDHNRIINCGRPTFSKSGMYGGIFIHNLKDSSIHDNVIDNTGNYGECIFNPTAYLYNVSIFNNDLKMAGLAHSSEGHRDPFTMEFWCLRGVKIYNNTSNGGFSIATGKETEIYNNKIIMNDIHHATIGIEFKNQSHGLVYNNYIYGGTSGIQTGCDFNGGTRKSKVHGTTIALNIIQNVLRGGIRVFSTGGSTKTYTINGFRIYNNTILGNQHPEYGSIDLRQDGYSTMSDIIIANNIIAEGNDVGGITIGTVDAIITNNLFWNNGSKNRWNNRSDIYSLVIDPLISKVNVAGITYPFLLSTSPARKAGINMGFNLVGSNPDLGAMQFEKEWAKDSDKDTAPRSPQNLRITIN